MPRLDPVIAEQGALFGGGEFNRVGEVDPVTKRFRGRPKGARGAAYLMAEKYLRNFSVDILDRLIIQAKAGEPTALKLCVERIFPAPKRPPSTVELPELKNRDEMLAAMTKLLQDGARGDIDMDDAVDISRIIAGILQAVSLPFISHNVVSIESADPRQSLADRVQRAIAAREARERAAEDVIDAEVVDEPADCTTATEAAENGHLDLQAVADQIREIERRLED